MSVAHRGWGSPKKASPFEFGKNMTTPIYEGVLRYCVRCCMPETAEGIKFDARGICNGCNSSEEKMHIDWEQRERALAAKLMRFREKGKDQTYDCLLPVSGGKDSFFQAYVLTQKYQMRPLAVTFSHNWFTETGKRNLERMLETFALDHIMFTPNRKLINRVAKRSIEVIGDSCWHCHAGVGAFVLQIAVRFEIPLIVWGESIAEEGCRFSYFESTKKDAFDEEYFVKVSAKSKVDDFAKEGVSPRELGMFRFPTAQQYRQAGIEGFHLGDYIFWDEERQVEFIKREFGWEEDVVEGTYKKYKSVECVMPGLHDYTKFVKRGFGRTTDHAARDVRAGLLTREEAFELVNELDGKRPDCLDYFLKETGMTESELIEKVKALREGKAKNLP